MVAHLATDVLPIGARASACIPLLRAFTSIRRHNREEGIARSCLWRAVRIGGEQFPQQRRRIGAGAELNCRRVLYVHIDRSHSR